MTATLEELIRLGGKFYSIGDESWCDTAVDSWKFNSALGVYVLQPTL